MIPRLSQLFEKAVKLEYGDRRQLLLGVPAYLPLAKAPPNNTLRQIPNDRVYLAWYNQTMDIVRLLTAAWSRLGGHLSPDNPVGKHVPPLCTPGVPATGSSSPSGLQIPLYLPRIFCLSMALHW